MKKYLYLIIIIGNVLFLTSFFCSYNYFCKQNSLKVIAEIVKPVVSVSEEIQKESELTKKVNSEKVKDKPLYNKEVFLTFDDGPSSSNTLKNLKTLNDNGVKATFFVIGRQAEKLHEIIKALNDSGMSIENHTYDHNYNSYKSEEACLNDFDKCNNVLEKLLNKKASKFIRFPGGSDNQVSSKEVMSKIRSDIVDKGLYYVDWNVCAQDAEAIKLDSNQIFQNVIDQCSTKKFAVVLMHDAEDKRSTADALDSIIKDLKSKGFVFRTFDDITPTEINEMLRLKIINRGT